MTQRFTTTIPCEYPAIMTGIWLRAKPGLALVLTQEEYTVLGNVCGNFNQNSAVPGACSGTPPPPPGDFCTTDDLRVSIFWGDYKRYETRNMGAFGRNTLCAAFPMQGSWSTAGYVSLAEYGGSPTARQMTISRTACDFRPVDPLGVNGPIAVSYGKQVTLYFNSQGADANLPPGQYFVNVRNWDPAINDWSVPADGDAPAGISIIWPHN